jgi:hypothetical protein
MAIFKSKFTESRLIISVYLLFILFISLLLALTADGNESRLSSKDIDKMLSKKWDEKGIKPSEKTNDEEFLRRLYLDLVGRIPSAEEVKSFLEDGSKDKRKKIIEELLASEEYGDFIADTWMQILFSYDAKRKVQNRTYNLVKDEFAAQFNLNKPYTEFVSKLVSANGFVTSNPYALYIGRFEIPEDAAGHVMKTFTGRQIQCAQCHKHPYEPITQEDFYGVASFFSRKQQLPLLQKDQAKKITQAITRMENLITKARDMEMEKNENMVEGSNEMNGDLENMDEHKNVKKKKKQDKSQNKEKKRKYNIPPQWAIDSLKQRMNDSAFVPDLLVWDAVNGQMSYEVKGEKKTADPKFLGGASISSDAGIERRTLLAENLVTTDSKQLAAAFVNRFWKHFFGYGFVNPIDDFTANDPGSNPELLNALAEEFVKSNFDVKNLFRLIVNSDAYQLSSTPNATNKNDHELFSRAVLRPMNAVQLANSLLHTSGYVTRMKNKDRDELDKTKFRILQLFVYTFDDDEMNEVENFSGTITQALLMMNSDITQKVADKKPGNFLTQLLKKTSDPGERIDMIYLNTIGRYPKDSEKDNLISKSGKGDEIYEDLLWALLNSSEFIFNH